MPGRQSHGAPPSKAPKKRFQNKKKSRNALNAFAIASQQGADDVKIRRNRLGEIEGSDNLTKRPRDDVEEEDDASRSGLKKQKTKAKADRYDNVDAERGSDSEGNEWMLGHVDSDNDSEIDSDEAFGESDEEGLENSKTAKSKRSAPKNRVRGGTTVLDLNEADDDGDGTGETESDDDNLGEDAIDLAAMLDATEEGDEVTLGKATGEKRLDGGSGTTDEESSAESDEVDESSMSSIETDEEEDADKLESLQNLISNLPQTTRSTQADSRRRGGDANEAGVPSEFGLKAKTKLTLDDLDLPDITDPSIKRSLKMLSSGLKASNNRKGIPGKLEVPLARREQDRLDRSAAYDKAKETLSRWTDTVAHNRRAEHLMFPLPSETKTLQNNHLQPSSTTKPFNELESAIQSILEESGLAAENGKDDEDKIREFEELEAKKMSLDEVRARRDQLRKARDLMFREEARSKRIKKIKSKSYRRVHRKQREKEERMNKEALLEGGFEASGDEDEEQERRRATERMGARHRGSKWAKETKQIGRAAWDDEARASITELARRDEQLRKRIEGKTPRDGDEFSDESSASDEADSDDEAVSRKMLDKLGGEGRGETYVASGKGNASALANMKFMQRAEAARKKENDETVEQMRRELAGEESSENDSADGGDVGRRIFGLAGGKKATVKAGTDDRAGQFEEALDSADEEVIINTAARSEDKAHGFQSKVEAKRLAHPTDKLLSKLSEDDAQTSVCGGSGAGAWSRPQNKNDASQVSASRRRKEQRQAGEDVLELDLAQASLVVSAPKHLLTKPVAAARKNEKKTKTLMLPDGALRDSDDDEGDDDGDAGAPNLPFALRDDVASRDLVRRAFAGADVVGEFEAEKRAVAEEEDDRVVDETLPGWGSWTGDGLGKKARERERRGGRYVTKVAGVVGKLKRKDKRLEKVIINERVVKKNGKYLASSLPHPFETRAQYERSLRLPVGPEWTTKETYQDATKPRVIVKQGIIAPMSKPLL